MRLSGTDITDSGIDLRPEQEISGLEVEMTNHPSEVAGIVHDLTGSPSRASTVVVFARDREHWRSGTRYVTAGRPDQNGRYRIRGLPAGEYYAVAVDSVEDGQWTDPEFLDRMREPAATIVIDDAAITRLDLKVVSER